MTLLRSSNLTAGYHDKAIVSEINLEVLKGQVVCILGPNGSGKTTILRTLCGLLAPVSGETYLNETNLKSYSKVELAKEMAVVLTERISAEYLKVRDLVGAARYAHTGLMGNLSETDLAAVTKALNLVSAAHLVDRNFSELSDGEQQKILLARALAQETEVIVLDEPTSFLDLKNRIEMIGILRGLSKEGLTVILSLHELDLALKCCDIAILVNNGRIVSWGPTESIVTEANIQSLYQLNNAQFNILTGNVELMNDLPAEIMVVAGGGTGVPVYRGLTRAGHGCITGILQPNDLDYQISQSMGIHVIETADYEPIGERTYLKTLTELDRVKTVIDTGFQVGTVNRKNIELIYAALNLNKNVFTFRKNYQDFYHIPERSIKQVADLPELVSELRRIR